MTEGILLGKSHAVHIDTSGESHCKATCTFSSRFFNPISFPVLVNQAEFCFEDIETGQGTSIKERF